MPDDRMDSGDGLSLEPSTRSKSPVVDSSSEEAEPKHRLPFLTVGIGASAGGVEAYIELFRSLPGDTGMAFVLIPHLSPDHKSQLPQILARYTAMPVEEIVAGAPLRPNSISVLAPSTMARVNAGAFEVEPRDGGSFRPIDSFLLSLAADQKNHAIGVVLSGMDADGAMGLKTIKAEGGISIVQSPASARFPEMPRSSISADHVDIILPPEEIAMELVQIAKQFQAPEMRQLADGSMRAIEDQALGRILGMMRSVSGIDFRLYKPNTIRRRIARRMLMHRIQTLANYVNFLHSNPTEIRELQEDALINVTRFFRDADVFDALKSSILPQIFQDRPPDQQVRVWVAGCSSGEEVYSIAICLLEFLTGNSLEPPIQIFGTDASEINIQRARIGIYPETVTQEVSQERLRRFFVKTERGYQVAKRVRDLCIFARQNLCHDPPFSRLDLISCRNVLIYFGAELQRQLIPTFHYALRTDGFLLLGTSETIREFTDLFVLRDRKHKVYSRIGSYSARPLLDISNQIFVPERVTEMKPSREPETWGDLDLQRAADRIILSRYGPPGVIVNDRLEIIQTRGHTGTFLEMPQGSATLYLPRMAKENIASQLNEAVTRAIAEDVPVQVHGLVVTEGEQTREIALEVLPVHTKSTERVKYYLVLFVPSGSQDVSLRRLPPVEPVLAQSDDKDRLITQMRHDLSATKLYLQSLLEERDAKNQELVSANEEIQSANEELQSTNEELETTKEELQSSNEELQTVNDELQNRNVVLTQASNDLSNLLNSVNLPVLMLSSDFSIRHFTPPTQRLMNLRSSDIGRPFGDIRLNLDVGDLEPTFVEVLETLNAREMEVRDKEGHWYLLRVRPYRTTDNKIDGLVVVLVDIDQHRRGQQELREARDFARSAIEGIPLPLVVINNENRIRATNEAFCSLAGSTSQDLENRLLPDLAGMLWWLDQPLRFHLMNLKADNPGAREFTFEHVVSTEPRRVFLIRGRKLQPQGSAFSLITFEDISAQKEAERLLKAEGERLATAVETTTKELGRNQQELRALAGSLLTAQELERGRVARELHDDVTQRLAAIEIQLSQAETALGAKSKEGSSLRQVRSTVSELVRDVRQISHRLHPSTLDELGLVASLRALTEDFRAREQMITTFTAQDVPEKLTPEISLSLYRIAQEALRNVSKHAGKTHVKVSLVYESQELSLRIVDFGFGFDMTDERRGLGLVSMEERARLVGGTLTVNSALGSGTEIVVNVPITEAA